MSLWRQIRSVLRKSRDEPTESTEEKNEGPSGHGLAEAGQGPTVFSEPSEFDDSLLNELPSVLDSINDSTREFNKVSRTQKEWIVEQSSAIHELAVSSEEFVASAKKISENAADVGKAADASLARCKQGAEVLAVAAGDMETLHKKVRDIAGEIEELGQSVRKISGALEIIVELTDQLELLSLNAQLEAAGAGEHGRRFGVVAVEVQRLSDLSREATGGIADIIGAILADTEKSVASARQGRESTVAAMERMKEVVKEIGGINAEVKRTNVLANEIQMATRQQTTAQEDHLQTILDLDMQVQKNADHITGQVEAAVTQMSDLAQYLTLILESTILGDGQGQE